MIGDEGEREACEWAQAQAEALLLAAVERFGREPQALLGVGSALHQAAHLLHLETCPDQPTSSPQEDAARARYAVSWYPPQAREGSPHLAEPEPAKQSRRRRRRGRRDPFDPRDPGCREPLVPPQAKEEAP